MEKLKLPVHAHPLYHVGGNAILGNGGLLLFCDGCYGEGHLDSGYGCSQCPSFYLHMKCAESPPTINHPSHPEHPLRLFTGSKCRGKRCRLCGVDVDILCYYCFLCDFTLDTGCAIGPPPLHVIEQPKAHEHTLTLALSTTTDSTDITCHVCGINGWTNKYFYLCSLCDLFFHSDCASLPPEINHPSHPRHLLKFLKGRSSADPSYCCTLCGLDIGHQNCYRCSSCNFIVDIRCVKNPPPLALVSPKTHKHELTCMPRNNRFTCNACGKQGDQSPYVCSQCNFMIHRSCIDLPRVIWINRHDHRITHTYDLDDTGSLDLECGVCRQPVDSYYGAYCCLECKNYVVHSRCATKNYVWNGRDLEGEPEEIEDVSPFKVIGNNLIKHFSHEKHDMEFVEEVSVEKEIITCRACTKPINAERFYKCMQCDFFLHEICANLPRKIRSIMIVEKLNLVGGASYFKDTFLCTPCGRFSSGFRYKNGAGNYFIDLECISTNEPLKREAHPHPLYFITEVSEECNSCKIQGTFGFKCLKGGCAFYLHLRCAMLPETIKHKSDDHTLRLCYQEYGIGKYWCDICEKEVDSYKQYYTCDDCRTTFHIKCAFGDLIGSITPGSILTIKGFDGTLEYDFGVVPNTGINRPLCCICDSRCTFSLVFKVRDNTDRYICSYDCIQK